MVFGVWMVSVAGVVVALSREGCEPLLRQELRAERSALTAGWAMRHSLPTDHPLAPLIAMQLVNRGPLAGIREEIHLGGRGPWLADRLRRAGWTVVETGLGAEPKVEIFAPDKSLRWSGGYRENAFETEGAMMLDTVVLQQVARGEAVGPYVPVGCGAVVPRLRRITTLRGQETI